MSFPQFCINMTKSNKLILFILIYTCLCFLSIYRHKNIEPNSFRTEIWADRAGYYVYLPSMFIYNFSGKNFPQNIELQTGHGFSLKKDKLITKYTYGVALLQLPFFIVADILSSASASTSRNGFSIYYQRSIDFASVFYLVLGLYFLFLSLKIYFGYKNKTILITLLLLFFGTNLYYYSIVETGMSHIYSFFLFSCLIYTLTIRYHFKSKYLFFFFLAIISSLIILIRPTNIIFISIIFLFGTKSKQQLIFKIKEFKNLRILLIWIMSVLLVFIPQFIYWKYSNGNYISYSYGDESFTNLLTPKFIEVLFAPNNGLFPYSLVFILILFGMVLNLKKNLFLGLYPLILFIVIWYITASWHDWKFGCGAGMRNIVEYYSLFSFPLCFVTDKILTISNKYYRNLMLAVVSLLVLISLKVNYHYFGCYFTDTWDWTPYINTFMYPFSFN